jgi:hypothetical protein
VTKTGFFQAVIRVTQSYDQACKDFIVTEYAEIAQHQLMRPPQLIKLDLLATLELLPCEIL